MAAPWRATVAGIAMSSGLGGPLLAVSGSVAAVETLGAGDQRLDCDQVVQHRAVGGPLVAALDGLEDAPVVRVRARGPARRVERFLAALREQVHERAHDPPDRPLLGPVAHGLLQPRAPHPPAAPPQ